MKRLRRHDLESLRFIARVGVARPEDLVTRFDFSQATAYRRVLLLQDLGLIRAESNISLTGKAYVATRAGIAATDLPLRVMEPTHSHALHDLAMTEAVSWIEGFGVDVLTERELIAQERISKSGRHYFQIVRRAGRFADTHKPDIICEIPDQGRFVAIEVELKPKSNERWRDILYGFKNRVGIDGFAGVLYLTGPNADVARLKRMAESAALGERFQQLDLAEPDYVTSIINILAVPDPPLFGSAA